MKLEVRLKKSKLKEVREKYSRWRNKKLESKILICTLFALCSGDCPFCGVPMVLSFIDEVNKQPNSATLDHTVPLAKILEHRKYGLEIICKACNNSNKPTTPKGR